MNNVTQFLVDSLID